MYGETAVLVELHRQFGVVDLNTDIGPRGILTAEQQQVAGDLWHGSETH
jgi:hypothetical protein